MIPSTILALFLSIATIVYLTAYFQEDIIIETSGRINTGFRVFYLENYLIADNPIPGNLHFFMSLTDYIEVDSSLQAHFGNEPVLILYEYTAVERLVIRYISAVDANINPIMIEEFRTLSNVSGIIESNSIALPGGTYAIYPQPHIIRYLEIIELQAQHMAETGILPVGMRGLSAELFMDFTYNLLIPDMEINQTISHGYRLSLSTEIYGISLTGSPYFTEIIYFPATLPFELTFPLIILVVAAMVLCSYGIFNGIKYIRADPNELRQEAITLLRKYRGEIVVSLDPVDISDYTTIKVGSFDELIKLAVNLNKHIVCFHNDEYAEFFAISDGYAYLCQIYYHQANFDDSEPPTSDSVVEDLCAVEIDLTHPH